MSNKHNDIFPLVSIFSFCKNGAKTIRRCIDSILVQDYPNVEIVVQDGASTDGTLEILQGYGDRIKLVSEADSGPNDAMFRALCRVKGEFFGSCLCDEQMMPGAISWAVANLQKHPDLAAIYGDHYITDIDGNITGTVTPLEWDLKSYLCSETTPPYCSSFFRTSCYRAIGFTEYTGNDEFDFWINLGVRFPIRYIRPPAPIAKYAVHPGSISFTEQHQLKRYASRKSAIQKLCDDPATPESICSLRSRALAGLLVWNAANLCKAGSWNLVTEYAPEAFRVGPNQKKKLYLANLIYRHILELLQKGELQETLEFLDLLKEGNVVGPELDEKRKRILLEIGKTGSAKESSGRQLGYPERDNSASGQTESGLSEAEQAKELFRRGIGYLQESDIAEALEYFERAAKICPALPDLQYAIGTACFQLGDIFAAQKACRAELITQPANTGAKDLLGRIEQAITECQKPATTALFDCRLIKKATPGIYDTAKGREPRFSFVMIVLNGIPFIEYSLKSVYHFAHEIIIVEGAVENCMFAANPDGSSKDGTVEFIKSFPDPDKKITFVQGKWPEKCEMQNEALKHVSGDYVWLIDSDEVYKSNDLEKMKEILKKDPSITQVNFIPDSFWKGLDYIFVSPEFSRQWCHFRRLFKYVPGAVFITHRPPTMVWPGSNQTTEQMNLLDGARTREMGLIFYHYSYVLEKQVRQKIVLYHKYGWGKNWNLDLVKWFNECYLKWTPQNREAIDAKYPIWTGDINSHTLPFKGTHPEVMSEYIVDRSILNNNRSNPLFVMHHVICAVDEIKRRFEHDHISAIETGTIRSCNEAHLSTYHISRGLGNRGSLISVDVCDDSIRRSGNICYDSDNIKYILSDSIQYLKNHRDQKFHFVFLDSANDKDIIFEEFRLVVPLVVAGGVLLVDDAGITEDGRGIDRNVAAQKGHQVWEFLRGCGIEPLVLNTPGGHGTQLKLICTRDNLVKIKQGLSAIENRAEGATSISEDSGRLDLETRLTRAHALLEQGHVVEALNELDSILATKPDIAGANICRAVCLIRLGRLLEAEVEVANVAGREPQNINLQKFAEQVRRLKPNLQGDRDIEWNFAKKQILDILKTQASGPKILDFGCGETAELARFTAGLGCEITAIDMVPLRVSLDNNRKNIHFIQGDFLRQDWTPQSFDLIINCSSIEHSGLPGRYGVVEKGTDDDLKIMAQMSELLKPDGKMLLTIPVGQDKVVGSLHRVYGPKRLTKLLDGWQIQSGCFWIKDENNQWLQVDSESALQREPMYAYGIGCYILQRAPLSSKRGEGNDVSKTANETISTGFGTQGDSNLVKAFVGQTAQKCAGAETMTTLGTDGVDDVACDSVKNILWVRTDAIGDNVLAASMLPYIRAKYKRARITVVCQEHITQLYESCTFADDVIGFERIRAKEDEGYRKQIVNAVRAVKADLCLNSVYSREPLTDILSIGSAAPQRFAFYGNLCNIFDEVRKVHNKYYTKLLSSDGDHKPELERHKDFLKALGISVETLKPTLWTTPEDENFADKFFEDNRLRPDNTIALFPSATHSHKVYEKYESVLQDFSGHNILVLGGSDAEAQANNILKALPGRCYNLAGKTTILQMASIMRRCRLYLGADSAGAHIACAVGIPNVVIVGGGHFGRFIPYSPRTSVVCLPLDCYGCNWSACHGEGAFCVKAVAPEVVAEACRQTLGKSSGKPRVFVQGSSLWKPGEGQPNWSMPEKFLSAQDVDFITVGQLSAEVPQEPEDKEIKEYLAETEIAQMAGAPPTGDVSSIPAVGAVEIITEGATELFERRQGQGLFRQGFQHLRKGDTARALGCFKEVAISCPTLSNLYYSIATAYFQAGDLSLARQACEKELSLRPENSGARELLERIEEAIGEGKMSLQPGILVKD